MTIIDVHGHVGSWPDFHIPEPSAEWLIGVNQRIGIDATGISHLIAVGHDVVEGNRLTLDVVGRHPDRLGAWLVTDPRRRDGVSEIAGHLDEPGVWGLKLHPDTYEYPIDGPGYQPYLELAREHGAPVLSHGQTRSPYSDPGQLAQVADRIEGLTVIVGHAGLWQDGFERAAELARETPGLYLEICGSRLTTHWLERMIEIAGAGKVLFGTDAVFLDPRVGLGKVVHARLDEAQRARVLGLNALEILGHRFRKEQ
jgi:predicted TIM-barrel fold metal-dependent hydrolase